MIDNSGINAPEKHFVAQKKLCRLAQKYRHQIVGVSTAAFIVIKAQVAQAQIFSGATNAMKCIVTAANTGGGGGTTSALFQQLPSLIFTTIEVILFAYIVYSVVQAIAASRNGEELTQIVQQPLVTFMFLVVIVLFQAFLFGGGQTCTN